MIYSSYDCHYLLVSIFTFLVMNSLTPSKKVFSFTSVCLLSISCLTSSTYGSCLDSFLLIAVSGMMETYNTICTLVLLLKKYALKGLIQNIQGKDGSYTECTKKKKKKNDQHSHNYTHCNRINSPALIFFSLIVFSTVSTFSIIST